MAAKEQQADIQQQQVEQQQASQQAALAAKANQQTLDLLAQSQASDKELEARDDALQLEQAAQALRLQDKEYAAQLDQIARERRVTDDISFRETARQELIGQNLDKTLKDINFNEAAASQRRITNYQSALDEIARAEAIMKAEAQDRIRAAKIGAVASAAKAGMSYGADEGWL